MGVIGDLLNLVRGQQPEPSSPAEAVAWAEKALADLMRERREAEAVLAGAADRRRDLLLRDAGDQEIAALDSEMDSARNRIENTELAEPILLDRLEACRDARRTAAWRALHKRQHAAALEYARALAAAVAAFENLAKTGDEALGGGFAHEAAASFAQPPRMVVLDMAERYHFEVERLHDAEILRQEGRPLPPAVIPLRPRRRPPRQPARPRRRRCPRHRRQLACLSAKPRPKARFWSDFSAMAWKSKGDSRL